MEKSHNIAENIRYYRNEGNLERAVKESDRGIACYPENNLFYKLKGDLLYEQKNYFKAAEIYLLFSSN